MKKLISILAVTLVFCYVGNLWSITLEEAQKIARKNNLTLNSSKMNFKSSKYDYYNSFSKYLPNVSFSTSRSESKVTDPAYSSSISLSQPIFNSSLILSNLMAKTQKNMAKNSLDLQYLTTDSAVADLYFSLLKTKELIEISKLSLESSEEQFKTIDEKYKLGIARYTDLLQWKVTVQNKKITLDNLINSYEILKLQWGIVLNLDNPNEFMPEPIEKMSLQKDVNFYADLSGDNYSQYAEKMLNMTKTSPSFKNIMLSEDLSKKSYYMAWGNFLPSVNFSYSKSLEERDDKWDFDGSNNWSTSLSISVPIFASGRNYTDMKSSYYSYKKTKFETMESIKNYNLSVKSTINSLINNSQNINSQKIALENAEENYNRLKVMYDEGMITNYELLDAEVMLFDAKNNLTISYYNYLISKFTLEKLVGGKI